MVELGLAVSSGQLRSHDLLWHLGLKLNGLQRFTRDTGQFLLRSHPLLVSCQEAWGPQEPEETLSGYGR